MKALFALIAAWILATGLGVVLLRNLLHAAVSMMMCFVGVAALYVVLRSELLAALQIVLYVGAITVLILFGIMLTVRRFGDIREPWNPRAVRLAPLMVVGLGVVIAQALLGTAWTKASAPAVYSTAQVADRLFRPEGWVVPFEIVGVVLLAALVGSIAVARKLPPGGGRT